MSPKTKKLTPESLQISCGVCMENSEVFAVITTDRSGIIQSWNKGAEVITRYMSVEAVGKEIGIFFTETDKKQKIPTNELRQALQEGRSEDERWHQRKDGSKFWAAGVLTPVYDEAENILGFCKVFRDHTARKRTEEQIHISNAELTRFSYTASHDLQQPIRTVVTYVQLAMRTLGSSIDPRVREELQIALDAAFRMRRLTGDLLAFAQAGAHRDMFELTNCDTALDMAVENLKAAIDESKAFVHRGALPQLKAVPTQICQVFQNLISNGIKYARPQVAPEIYVLAERKADCWQFSVKDNGVGIAPKDLDRIFGAFERAHPGGKAPGSGLGLTITKRIVESHGGRIWAMSSIDSGTTIFFTLPA